MIKNMHLVDELAVVRAKIKALKAQEEGLVADIKDRLKEANHISWAGNFHIATLSESERVGSIDTKKMAADGIHVDRYRKPPTTVVRVLLEEIEREEE